MSNETTVGYSIEIKGTDTAVGKMADMKRELIDLTSKYDKLRESTKGNEGAQKASATQMAVLSTQIKALTSEINTQQQAIIKTANYQKEAVGSYNALSLELSNVTARWKELSAEERDNTDEGKALTAQRLALNTQLKELDATVGVHSRNVGDYNSHIIEAARGVGGLSALIGSLGKALGFETEAFTEAAHIGREAIKVSREFMNIKHGEEEIIRDTTGATEAETGVKVEQSAVTKELTIAEKALLAVKEASLEVWVGLAFVVAAAAAAIVGFIVGSKAAEEQEKKTQVATDGTIIKNKELRDSYNEAIVKLTEIDNAWKVHLGIISELDAAYSNIAAKNKVTLQNIKNDTQAELNETSGLWAGLKALVTGGAQALQDRVKEIQTEGFQKEKMAELNAQIDKDKAKRELIAKNQDQEQADLDEWQRVQDENRKKYQDKIEAEIKSNNAKILKLQADLIKEQYDLQKPGVERDFAQITDKYDAEIHLLEGSLIKKKKLRADEIALNKATNDQITALEKLKEADLEKLGKDAEKSETDILIKQNNLKKDIVIQEINNEEQQKKDEINSSVDSLKSKSKQLLEVDIEYSNRKLSVSKQTAINDLLILKNSADAETEETKLKIAKLEAIINQAERIGPQETLLAKLFGSDDKNAALIINKALDTAKQVSDVVFQAKADANARELQQTVNHLTDIHDTEAQKLQASLTSGAITQAQFDIQKKAADEKFREDELAAKKRAFEKDKDLKVKQVETELAIGIVRTFASAAEIGPEGYAVAVIEAAALAVTAGIQIAAIKNQKFSGGGVLVGASHDEGGIPFTVNGKPGFEAEEDEILLTKGVYRNPYLRSMASQLNVAAGGKHFAGGGVPLPSVSSSSLIKNFVPDMNGFANQIVSGINSKKVYNSITEVSDKQQEIEQLDRESTF